MSKNKVLLRAGQAYLFTVTFRPDKDVVVKEGKTYDIIAPITFHHVNPDEATAIPVNARSASRVTHCRERD